MSRAEAALRKMTQDWVQACNTKHLDDLLEFYAPDALVLRPMFLRYVERRRSASFSLARWKLAWEKSNSNHCAWNSWAMLPMKPDAARCWSRWRWANAAKSAAST